MVARTFRFTGLVFLALAFALTCALAAGLVFGWWRVLPVQSGSMHPTIPRGAAVIVTPESFDEIRVGQIIVYDPPTPGSSLLVHRVVEIARNGSTVSVQTRGDANDANDPWVADLNDPPVWRVVRVVPHAGTVVDLLRNRMLRLALFPLAMLGLALAALATIAQMPSVAEQLARAAEDEPPAPAAAGTRPLVPLAGGEPERAPASRPQPVEVPAPVPGPAGLDLVASVCDVPTMTALSAASLRAHRPSSLRAALMAAGVAVDAPLVDEHRAAPHLPGALLAVPDEPAITVPAEAVLVPAGPGAEAQAEVSGRPIVVEAPPVVATPADWYRDPTGRFEHRWFDGDCWTAHVATAGERRTDALR